jgi:hypothetical protein
MQHVKATHVPLWVLSSSLQKSKGVKLQSGLRSDYSAYSPVAGFYKHGNDTSDFISDKKNSYVIFKDYVHLVSRVA